MFANEAQLKDRILELTGRKVRGSLQIFDDTTSYSAICDGTVLRLSGGDYYVRGEMTEGRFGIDEQPKFWVKHAIDLESGAKKIIKMVFREEFSTSVAGVRVRCQRSSEKETAILELTRGKSHFMQGVTFTDALGAPVRVIDFVYGQSVYSYINALEMDHLTYYEEVFPDVLQEIVACIEAMGHLHQLGQHHGDIRNDHILIDRDLRKYTWIDFDYRVNFSDYDIWTAGNVLNFVVGKGINTFHRLKTRPGEFPYYRGHNDGTAAVALFPERIADLRSLFPYISEDLNAVLMRFSTESDDFYESFDDLVSDVRAATG